MKLELLGNINSRLFFGMNQSQGMKKSHPACAGERKQKNLILEKTENEKIFPFLRLK